VFLTIEIRAYSRLRGEKAEERERERGGGGERTKKFRRESLG